MRRRRARWGHQHGAHTVAVQGASAGSGDGLYHLRARDYGSLIDRFVQPDAMPNTMSAGDDARSADGSIGKPKLRAAMRAWEQAAAFASYCALPGRDARYRAPPGQIRACAANALGSHLGCWTRSSCCQRRRVRRPAPVTHLPGSGSGMCFADLRFPRPRPFPP